MNVVCYLPMDFELNFFMRKCKVKTVGAQVKSFPVEKFGIVGLRASFKAVVAQG